MVVFLGDVDGSADEGRSERFRPAAFAFFCAAMASLMEGLVEAALVLFEKAGFPPVVAT